MGTFPVPALRAMLASVPGQVAYYGPELAGFVVNSRLPAAQYPPLVQAIIAQLPTLRHQQRALAAYRWFFYGPVLVRPPYRGRGLLRQLFEASRRTLTVQFELGLAFIATDNAASLRVHTQALGLAVLTATPQASGTVLLSTPTQTGLTYQFYLNANGTATAAGTPNTTGTLLLTAGTQTGSYTVMALAGSYASSPSAAVTATVLSTVTATLDGVSLRVFPNPTVDGQLSLELSGANAKASQLTVLNALGQVVHTGPVAPGTAQLKLGYLAPGVYTFRVLTE